MKTKTNMIKHMGHETPWNTGISFMQNGVVEGFSQAKDLAIPHRKQHIQAIAK